jgi:MOSC domain-containing protein YiiM
MAFNPGSSLAKLIETPVRPGKIIWIGLRPIRRGAMEVVESARLESGLGLAGDRYSRKDGVRQVTLIAVESLTAIAGYLGEERVSPEALRRNIVTQGINLSALKDRRFKLGETILETTGECHPCSRMEETLGQGGYNAVRGLGGITARVIKGGEIHLNDPIAPIPTTEAALYPTP